MEIRTILAGASGGTASGGAIELACRFAKRFGAHLEGVHVRVDVTELVIAAGAEGLAAAEHMHWVGDLAARAEAKALKTKVAFAEASARHGLPVVAAPEPGKAGASWREEVGDAPAIVSRHARFFDLAVLGRSDRVIEKPHSDAIEQTLIDSGRPVLLAPAEPPAVVGERIAIGWNGSAQAVRAVAAALPFLREASDTVLIAVDESEEESGELVKGYLALHGIAARVRSVLKVPAVGPGGQLLSAAREEGADLLVMGGYSRPPWREMLFGGATREVVGIALLPLLITH